MTGHLKKLQSPISKSYFETIEYVKVPAFWSSGHRELSSELIQPFDTSLLNPPERIPDGAASAIAVISYVIRLLQIMICESSMFKDNLMWDPKYQSWRLMFAVVPQTKDTPPIFYQVTWKQDCAESLRVVLHGQECVSG